MLVLKILSVSVKKMKCWLFCAILYQMYAYNIVIYIFYVPRYSKQAFLNDVQQPFTLPDGSPSFKDYMGNRNNRFTNPEAASKNRILPPSKMLHFFNAPFGISEDEMKKVLYCNMDICGVLFCLNSKNIWYSIAL